LSVAIAVLGGLLFVACGAVNLGGAGKGKGKSEGDAQGEGSGLDLGGLKDAASAAKNCPNLASVEAIADVDFVKEFGVNDEGSAKLKSALTLSAEIKAISAEIDSELETACGKLANDLGKKPKRGGAKDACKAAAKAIAALKAKAGGSFELDVVPPKCSASMDAMADCAAKCDTEYKPGKADVQCEGGELSGSCDAKCKGKCDVEAGAACSGSCSGSCEAKFSGTCSGKCDGKCEGKTTNGAASCEGKCEGSCDAGARGSCKGTCKGECEIKGQAKCKGTCTGKCSAKMKAPKCTGEVKPPEIKADCKAHCNAKVNARMECTPAHVAVKAKGTADAEATEKLTATLKADLPAVLKVAIGMKDKVVKVAGDVDAAVTDVKDGLEAMVEGSPAMTAKLAACVADPFKGAFDAVGDIKSNVDVSVSVQASVSAKGSASAKSK
jgi:hypothetical protein